MASKVWSFNYKQIKTLRTTEAVRGLHKLDKLVKTSCVDCQSGKQIKSYHKQVQQIITSNILVLIHMDLFGPTQTESIGGKMYAMLFINDYSRFTWVRFLS
jgi:transposase InsO family protein